MTTQTSSEPASIAEVVQREVERTITRSVRGIDVLLNRDEPEVAMTPKEVVHHRGTLRLYHYLPQSDEVYRVPVVLVMSLISKPYILDLTPGVSFVEFLLKQGFDVFMIDWGVPRPEDSKLRLEDYTLDFIPECIARVQETTGERDVSFIGYCMGGLLTLIYGGLVADAPMANLVCIATPVDYEGMGLFKQWTDRRWFDVDRVVDSLGNIPPELMYRSFELLRPADRLVAYVRLWDNLWNDQYVKHYRLFNKWTSDQIPFPGECFRQTTKELMWENKLLKGELDVGGKRVDLRRITCPVLNAMAQHDHIAPYEATHKLTALVGSEDKEDVVLKGGHVSLVAGMNAVTRLWPKLNQWLAVRSV
ncbi:MAG TPA: alpha/beta fold hydrolase [Dehalococcoidia bacterium]|nr:alpha/beta fold hydrolase [Dehalococcoidia bacterium]